MILIADSGSTNTDWIIIHENKIRTEFTTSGLNPYFITSHEVCLEVQAQFPADINKDTIGHLYFYGSGCSSPDMKNIIYNGLQEFFPQSKIDINHDLLGAARALLNNEEGIAIILGTGANTCLYNGQNISSNVASLGFILGDEGGGDYLGKLFITEYLYGNLPHEISDAFFKKYALTNSEIMHKIYKEPFPNRFLSSLCTFILDHSKNEFIKRIIKKSFKDLFLKHIVKYENYTSYNIRITGSVGFYFQEFLYEIAEEFKATIDLIERSPIRRLAQYHIDH